MGRHFAGFCRAAVVAVVLVGSCLLLAGCAAEEVAYTEAKRIDDRISSSDLRAFLSVIDSLPDQKLPPLPSIQLPPPQWSATRTLPVLELVFEEEKLLDERSSIAWLSRDLHRARGFMRQLRRVGFTVEQFVGVAVALGTALSRDQVPEDVDLDAILERGQHVVSSLRKDHRVFASLTDDTAHSIRERGAWITVVDRVTRLKKVPPENLALVRKYRERLQKVFPEEFKTDPLEGLSKVIRDEGVPFEELTESGSDDQLRWRREQALIGTPVSDEND